MSDEHGIVNGDRDGFNYLCMQSANAEKDIWQECIDKFGNAVKLFFNGVDHKYIKKEEIHSNSTIYTERGSEKINVSPTGILDTKLYHLVLNGGSRTYSVGGVFVSGWCNNESFLKFSKGE